LNFTHKNIDCVWSPDGSQLYVAGNPYAHVTTRQASASDGKSSLIHSDSANITLLCMPSKDVLITVGSD